MYFLSPPIYSQITYRTLLYQSMFRCCLFVFFKTWRLHVLFEHSIIIIVILWLFSPPPPKRNCFKGGILFPSYYRIRLTFPRKSTLVWNFCGKILSQSQISDGKSISRVNFPKESGFCRGHTIQEQNPNEFSSQPFSEWFQVLIHSNLSLFVSISSHIVGILFFFLKLHLLVIILSTGIKI